MLDELESVAENGQLVQAMVNTKGWKEVVKPALESRVEACVRDISVAKEHGEFIAIQQAMNAINNLIDFIEVTLIDGKEAYKEIRNVKR